MPMLRSKSIPQFEDDAESWGRFLNKAAKGSIKAPDMLCSADMAYMVALTGDPQSPSALHLDDYANLFRSRFPVSPPGSLQDLHDRMVELRWLPQGFRVTDSPRRPAKHYRSLWGRNAVDWTDLANDAMFLCLNQWSADHCRQCTGEYRLDYDSRNVVAGMFYLCLTWPDA